MQTAPKARPRLRRQGRMLVGATRFERATPSTPSWCASQLRHAPNEGIVADRACQVKRQDHAVDGVGLLLERDGLNVRVLRPQRRQRVNKLELPSGNLGLDGGPREVAKYEPVVRRIMPDVHELKLKRGLE